MSLFPNIKPEKPKKLYGNDEAESRAILHLLRGKAKCDLDAETRTAVADRLEKAIDKKWPAEESEATEDNGGEATEK